MRELTAKIIQRLLNGNETMCQQVAGEIEAAYEISAKVRACDANLRALEKEFAEKKAAVELARREIQAKCTHAATTYHADAAGGSDSLTRCDACGKDLGR